MSTTEMQPATSSTTRAAALRRASCMLPLALLVAVCLLAPDLAFAQGSSSGDPWGNSLSKLAGMLNSTVAKGIGTIALFAAGGMLVFGGELNEFTKKILMVVLAVSVMVLGGGMINSFFS